MARVPQQGPKPAPGDRKLREALVELYAELPTIECKGLCAESCGPILMSRVEWQRVCKAGGERHTGALNLTCPYLEEKRCSVYEVRPMICRLWGLVETMPCSWGCMPEPGYLSKEQGFEFLTRARALS